VVTLTFLHFCCCENLHAVNNHILKDLWVLYFHLLLEMDVVCGVVYHHPCNRTLATNSLNDYWKHLSLAFSCLWHILTIAFCALEILESPQLRLHWYPSPRPASPCVQCKHAHLYHSASAPGWLTTPSSASPSVSPASRPACHRHWLCHRQPCGFNNSIDSY